MFYQQKINTYTRSYENVGFIISTDTLKDKMVNESASVFLNAINRTPQSLDELTDKIMLSFSDADRETIKNDAKEFFDSLADEGFIIKAATKEELNKKNLPPSADITSMRVFVTERCNANCPSCINANARTKSEMPVEKFALLCKYLSKNGITHLKLMGGEPTVHKDFEKIIQIAQENFKGITIFTNGINGRIENIEPRENDGITFNFLFNKNFSRQTLFLNKEGRRTFQVQVLNDCNEIELADRIVELVNLDKERIGVALSLDCTSNIFKNRAILVNKLSVIEKILIEDNINFHYDNKIPLCFLEGTNLHVKNDGMCAVDISGLIDSDLTLRYCNQNAEKNLKLYDSEKKRFVKWEMLLNHLFKISYSLRQKALDKICLNCRLFNRNCNGGCWISKDFITKEDVTSNTNFSFKEYE